jgi:dihydrofolate reductase
MGIHHVHLFMSLDGVIESPSWTFDYGFDPEMGEELGEITGASEAILLGRKTYEMFYPAWSERTAEDDPGAPFFNETPKHVVTSTLTEGPWNNTHILGGYDAEQIRELKASTSGDIYTSGSAQLVRQMLTDGLVDRLHLFVYPVALGAGQKLFVEGEEHRLALDLSRTYANGVVRLTYKPA